MEDAHRHVCDCICQLRARPACIACRIYQRFSKKQLLRLAAKHSHARAHSHAQQHTFGEGGVQQHGNYLQQFETFTLEKQLERLMCRLGGALSKGGDGAALQRRPGL